MTKKASSFALASLVVLALAARGAAQELETSAAAAAISPGVPSPFESPPPRLRLWPALRQDFRRLAWGPNLA